MTILDLSSLHCLLEKHWFYPYCLHITKHLHANKKPIKLVCPTWPTSVYLYCASHRNISPRTFIFVGFPKQNCNPKTALIAEAQLEIFYNLPLCIWCLHLICLYFQNEENSVVVIPKNMWYRLGRDRGGELKTLISIVTVYVLLIYWQSNDLEERQYDIEIQKYYQRCKEHRHINL